MIRKWFAEGLWIRSTWAHILLGSPSRSGTRDRLLYPRLSEMGTPSSSHCPFRIESPLLVRIRGLPAGLPPRMHLIKVFKTGCGPSRPLCELPCLVCQLVIVSKEKSLKCTPHRSESILTLDFRQPPGWLREQDCEWYLFSF